MSVNINRAGVAAVGGAGIRPNLLNETNLGSTNWLAMNGDGTYSKETIEINGKLANRYTVTTQATNWCVSAFQPTNVAEVREFLHNHIGEQFTVSFDFRPSTDLSSANIIPRFCQSTSQLQQLNFPSFSAKANEWNHYIGVATAQNVDIGTQYFYINYKFVPGTYDFMNLKLEYGDTATPYCLSESEGFIAASFAESSSTPPSFGKNWISVKDFTEI